MWPRTPFALLLLISAATPSDEVLVDCSSDAVIVRSPMDQGNFLFRLPASFKVKEPEEGFAADVAADVAAVGTETESARVRVRVGPLPVTETRSPIEAIARARESVYKAAPDAAVSYSPDGNRCLVSSGAENLHRTVLVVVDGARLYEVLFDKSARDGLFAEELHRSALGFTLLDPRGRPDVPKDPEGDAKEKLLEHDYYRLKVLKPMGFAQMEVDPNREAGIWLHLRRVEETKGACDIRIRIHLARTLKESCAAMAQKPIDDFKTRYIDAKVPSRPTKSGWPASREAYKMKFVGKMPNSGLVVNEEFRIVEHDNGRLYEFQMTSLGGAPREFKKEIDAFWKALRIIDR